MTLSPITADEISEARRLLANYEDRPLIERIELGVTSAKENKCVATLLRLLPRLLSEREPVGDGEVEEAVAKLDNPPMASAGIVHRDGLERDHRKVASLLRRLARQCAEQRALLAEPRPSLDAQGYIRLNTPGSEEEWLARRDALLNQESGK